MKGRKPNPNRPKYSAMIAEARSEKGWTQAELGVRIDKDWRTVKDYESGKRVPPFDVLYAICQILEIDLNTAVDSILKCNKADFQEFINKPFSKAESLLDYKKITLASSSPDINNALDNEITFLYNDKQGSISKTEFIRKVCQLKHTLKQKYLEDLSKAVNNLAKDIAEGKSKDK